MRKFDFEEQRLRLSSYTGYPDCMKKEAVCSLAKKWCFDLNTLMAI